MMSVVDVDAEFLYEIMKKMVGKDILKSSEELSEKFLKFIQFMLLKILWYNLDGTVIPFLKDDGTLS